MLASFCLPPQASLEEQFRPYPQRPGKAPPAGCTGAEPRADEGQEAGAEGAGDCGL